MPSEHLDPTQILACNPYIHYISVDKRLEAAESAVAAACSTAASSSSAAAEKQKADQRGTAPRGVIAAAQHNTKLTTSGRLEFE
ncbi:hypothetical protein GOP47_0029468, partial [Adiantum capillus-veneris]